MKDYFLTIIYLGWGTGVEACDKPNTAIINVASRIIPMNKLKRLISLYFASVTSK